MSREAFEAWALRNTSLPSAHEMAWAAWQAALAQPQAEPIAWGMLRADGLVLDVICPEGHAAYEGEYKVPLYATPQQAQPTAPDVPEDDFGNMPMPSREKREEFERLCNALPPDVCWGDPITADIVRSIVATFTPAAPAVPDGWVMVPREPTVGMISAMMTSTARDDEGAFPMLMDHLDYSGENKSHTVLKAAYRAMIAAAPAVPAAPELETRADGELVRVDRWEWGIRRIVALLWGNRHAFEVDEVVDAVRGLVPTPNDDDESLCATVQNDYAVPAVQPQDDCAPNHFCNRRFVHLPHGEQCDRCGHE